MIAKTAARARGWSDFSVRGAHHPGGLVGCCLDSLLDAMVLPCGDAPNDSLRGRILTGDPVDAGCVLELRRF